MSTTNAIAPTTEESGAVTKQQQYAERVHALVNDGLQQSDALKKVAEENGVAVSTVRGAIYRAGGTRSNGKQKPPVDPIEAAVQLFRDAITNIDTEMETLKQRADEARNEYGEAVKTADARRTSYEQKIKALS
jgi:transposase